MGKLARPRNKMSARILLWVDLRVVPSEPDLCSSLPKAYAARRVRRASEIIPALQTHSASAVCFEYDRPDLHGLEALSQTRARYSWLPILMVTGHHDEALALWALKRCVWDYLVKPLPVRRLCDSLVGIYRSVPGSMAGPLRRSQGPVPAQPSEAVPSHHLAPAMSYVERNFAEKIRLSTVARICNLSPFQFSRNFKKENGINFREFVVKLRIHHAAQLIRESGASVTDAAFVVGFNDLSYFARMFRRQLGVAPSRYKTEAEPVQLALFPDPERK